MKINIGCGNDTRKGYTNIDNCNLKGVDKVMNLNKIPYDFKDNSCDEILAYQILEHLEDSIKVIKELHRISKPNSIIHIGVPYFASAGAWTDITHKRPFGITSFDYMAINPLKHSSGSFHQHEYGSERFEILERKFIFGKLHRLLGISWFAHKFPMFYELYLPFIFPSRHIEFKLRVVK